MKATHPPNFNVNKDKTCPNVEGIWWSRVRMCQLVTSIFSNLGPPANCLIPVTKDEVLDPTMVLLNLQPVLIIW